MKIIKDNWLIVLIIAFILTVSICTAKADHKPTTEMDGLYWSQLPTICGTTEAVQEYITHNEFVLDKIGVGRENAKQEGNPVYMVSYFNTADSKQGLVVITSPSGLESCMLFRAFDLIKSGTKT